METSGAVTIEGENYEVVDECIEEDDTSGNAQQKSIEKIEVEKKSTDIALAESNVSDENINQEQLEAINSTKNLSNASGESINQEQLEATDSTKNLSNASGESINQEQLEATDSTKNLSKVSDENINQEQLEVIDSTKNLSNVSDENINQEQLEATDSTKNLISDKSNSDNDIEDNAANTEIKCPQESCAKTIDFTADINLDQLDVEQKEEPEPKEEPEQKEELEQKEEPEQKGEPEQKEETDEDVLHNLDEIENIVLDASEFQVQNNEKEVQLIFKNEVSNVKIEVIEPTPATNEVVNVDNDSSDDINKDSKQNIKIEKSVDNDWYERKLTEKESIIKERLSKVARVLTSSYPCYEKLIEHEERTSGCPLCKLKPSRRCCLDKPYTNRWKFICNRKKVFDSSPRTDNTDGSTNKHAEVIWKLEASGAWGVNVNNESEFPPFVLRAVKIFEDFLQTTEQITSQNSSNENFSDDISLDVESKKEISREGKQVWSWLLVRCNSMDELMLFATGWNISRSTMDRLKQVYETGPGKDCNVKSLYCKSINKCNDTTVTDTTFLVGSEALDEIVGGLKVQLAPKTNFWSNTAGAVNVANTVIDILAPTPRTTVLDIGCGIGLIGLMMASRCRQVIGVDSPSEVEEAEMICELNNIRNASFIMGSPAEVTPKIFAAVKNRRTCAVINTNTNIGRAIEVMTCLRRAPSLKRIVMITTLTKQSVRAILELARPGDPNHGPPFVPILACVVDTSPMGPHFEAVILLQRRIVEKLIQSRLQKAAETNIIKLETTNTENKIDERNTNNTAKKTLPTGTEMQSKKHFNKPMIKYNPRKSKIAMKKMVYVKNLENPTVRNKFRGKRSHSPDKGEAPPMKVMKKFGKFGAKSWNKDLPMKKKKEWNPEKAQTAEVRDNPVYEKKMRESNEQTDLRERLSNNRLDTDIAQTVKEHQALLEIAKEKLSGSAPTVDVNTAKQLQSMLNMVLEQTNKLQSQLPRSVWDRIAPRENMNSGQRENEQQDPALKGRYVQEIDSQDILIITQNKKFSDNEEPMTKPIYKKYNNLPPLEPNTVMPVAQPTNHREKGPFRITPERYHETDMRPQQTQENLWNRDRTFERNRWNEMGNMKMSNSPMKRDYRGSPPKRLSPKRPLLSPPRRPCSPPRRHFSPLRRPTSPMYRQRSPIRRQMSPLRRPLSPRRPSPPQRPEMLMNRPMSPLRRQVSPLRQLSPMRSNISPSRRQPSPMKRPMSPPRRQIPSPNRLMCPSNNRPDMLLARRQPMPQERQQTSTMRRAESPQRFLFERPTSPPRRQQSPQRRQISPQRFGDEWDIPSRGAVEQSTWTRPVENIWRPEKATTSNNNWEQGAGNDKRRKTFSQETNRNDTWNKGGNTWSSKQLLTNPLAKETWSSNSINRWSNTASMPGSSNTNWNIRGKESFTPSKDLWMDNKKQGRWESLNVKDSWKQNEKEDINDLPEDAKDPWGDDGTTDLKERWHKFDGTGTSSLWLRENEQGDSWTKNNKDSWQNNGSSFSAKPQWQNNGVQKVESRWLSQNDTEKKTSSSGWQSGNTVGSWQAQNSNFQSQRPFSTNQFKGLY